MNNQEKWDRRYLELAAIAGSWSKDPSTKVGAVLVTPDNRVAAMGYNGFPSGYSDLPELYQNAEYKRRNVIHAEVNAMESLGIDYDLTDYVLITTFPVCPDCASFAVSRGIIRFVTYPIDYLGKDDAWRQRWSKNLAEAKQIVSHHTRLWVEYPRR